MIFTARQLQDLHKTNGHVTLPVGARLTPMAADWARSRKIAVVYDGQAPTSVVSSATAKAAPPPPGRSSGGVTARAARRRRRWRP